MLKELVNEVIELLNEAEAKDNRISELQAQVQNLINIINNKNEENKLLNDQITALQLEKEKLQRDLEIANSTIVEKENNVKELEVNVSTCEERIDILEGNVSKLEADILNLQVQADLKLDEVKVIVEELKGLIVNA